MFWDRLEHLRAGRAGVGGVVYEISDRRSFLDMSDPDNPVADWELLFSVHPGISSGLTTAERIVGNLPDMGLEKWQREYLCLWPLNVGVTALDVAAWEACAVDTVPERPENCGVSWAVDKAGESSAIVAAWRDAQGRASFEVLAFGPGFDWVPREAARLQKEHRQPFGYDAIGPCIEVADTMSRPPYRVRNSVLVFKDQVGSHARLDKEISKRNVVHYSDPDLTRAVECSAWRPAGGARMFLNRPGSCVLFAATQALWLADQRTRGGRLVVTRAELEQRRAERQARTA
jgi:hypothetical protein